MKSFQRAQENLTLFKKDKHGSLNQTNLYTRKVTNLQYNHVKLKLKLNLINHELFKVHMYTQKLKLLNHKPVFFYNENIDTLYIKKHANK